MTPGQHLDRAELIAVGRLAPYDNEDRNLALGQLHATLALAGFTRDARSTPQTEQARRLVVDVCKCGHKMDQHIYGKGACHPGFVCSRNCEKFQEAF